MIAECPHCHMTLLDQFNGQFRCWWCHIWLTKDQIVILGENKETYWDKVDSADHDLHRQDPVDVKSKS